MTDRVPEPDDASASITHIAGQAIVVRERFMRQRCGWCGAVLEDYDLARIAMPIGQDPMPGHWELGALVRVDGGVSYLIEADELPDDACALLDVEITL